MIVGVSDVYRASGAHMNTPLTAMLIRINSIIVTIGYLISMKKKYIINLLKVSNTYDSISAGIVVCPKSNSMIFEFRQVDIVFIVDI